MIINHELYNIDGIFKLLEVAGDKILSFFISMITDSELRVKFADDNKGINF